MSANLHVIHAEPEGSDAVRVLEELLERAKAGDLSAVAVSVVYRDGPIGSQWSYTPNIGSLLGAIVRAQHCISKALDEQ